MTITHVDGVIVMTLPPGGDLAPPRTRGPPGSPGHP